MYPNRLGRMHAHRVALLIAAMSVGASALPAFAQDAVPDDAPAVEPDAAPVKPKPRRVPPKPKPVERKAVETKPPESKPPESKLSASKPDEAAPTDAKPAEIKGADAKAPSDGALLVPAAAPASAPWPNGASSVSESYGDWTMTCTREGTRTACAVMQSQGDRRTGKRQFSIELRSPRDGRAEGMILMPFGMQIEPGVNFKIDERVLGKGAPYTSCVTDGCLVPISLPTIATDTLQTGQMLSVAAVKPDAKEQTVIQVPLAGFAAAFTRAIALGG